MDRFAFGENWKDFAERVNPEAYAKARASVQALVGDLRDKTFLDIGCGSGLFSIAAAGLGAREVTDFDLDPQSVEAARITLSRAGQWEPNLDPSRVRFQVESILNPDLNVKPYDVVYSWGVLHHTGAMSEAFTAAARLVAPGGTLAIAIYNRHWTAPIWKVIKGTYVKSPRFLRPLLVWPIYAVKLLVALLIRRQNPFRRDRGMRYYTDIVDWVGGYPYEYASIREVTAFFEALGFQLVKAVPTQGLTGCNEFVFRKPA